MFDLKQVLVAVSQHSTEPDSFGHAFAQSESVEHVEGHCAGGGGGGGGGGGVAGIVDVGAGSAGAASWVGPGSEVAHAASSATRERPAMTEMLAVRIGVRAL